jgi:hypothetical protein
MVVPGRDYMNPCHWLSFPNAPYLHTIRHVFDIIPPQLLMEIRMPQLTSLTISRNWFPRGFILTLADAFPNLTLLSRVEVIADSIDTDSSALSTFQQLTRMPLKYLDTTVWTLDAITVLPVISNMVRSLEMTCDSSISFTQLSSLVFLNSLTLLFHRGSLPANTSSRQMTWYILLNVLTLLKKV